jgi:hypothetical protein
VATHPAVPDLLGAKFSMPGMMQAFPKLGMTAEVAKAMGVQSGKKCSTQ